jgi:hypothetical protein
MNDTKEKHATFTPGPWVVKHDKKGLPFIGVASDPWTYPGTVATVEDEKDARLIAAAPEMYEVLQELAESMELAKNYGYEKEHAMIREVLAKVDGGEG